MSEQSIFDLMAFFGDKNQPFNIATEEAIKVSTNNDWWAILVPVVVTGIISFFVGCFIAKKAGRYAGKYAAKFTRDYETQKEDNNNKRIFLEELQIQYLSSLDNIKSMKLLIDRIKDIQKFSHDKIRKDTSSTIIQTYGLTKKDSMFYYKISAKTNILNADNVQPNSIIGNYFCLKTSILKLDDLIYKVDYLLDNNFQELYKLARRIIKYEVYNLVVFKEMITITDKNLEIIEIPEYASNIFNLTSKEDDFIDTINFDKESYSEVISKFHKALKTNQFETESIDILAYTIDHMYKLKENQS